MQLRKGAFGRVFLAKKDGKEYALKETLSSGRKATKAAQRESKLMVELDHINIVKLYEYFTFGHPAKCFMIMVWFPLINRYPDTSKKVLKMAFQVPSSR